jgi:GH15 family glucan-1,4-alpha-glucosidase
VLQRVRFVPLQGRLADFRLHVVLAPHLANRGGGKPDDDLGGYHLVWPRDLVETAGSFIAIGAHQEARRVLRYLQVTQEADGHWSQNMWLHGTPDWHGIQMDETALPILLAPAIVRWSAVDWRTVHDTATVDTTLGVHVADLPTTNACTGSRVSLTFYWPEADRWEGCDFSVGVDDESS